MNPVLAYAKLPMFFRNLYRSRRGQGNYVVAIACAMAGLLIVNIWSGLMLLVSVAHTPLIGTRHFESGPSVLVIAFIFIIEFLFVGFVFRKADTDPKFGEQVRSTKPAVSMWYAGISVSVLAASNLTMIFTT